MIIKIFLFTISILLILGVGVYFGSLINQKKVDVKDNITNLPISTVSTTILPTLQATPNPSSLPTASLHIPNNSMGAINGKLCYPSSFIPKGTIEAKNIATNKVTEQEFMGSDIEKKQTFTIPLEVGTYILRYKVTNSENNTIYGYSTDVCSTGVETTCANTNKRKNNEFKVVKDVFVDNVNICDYYFSKDTEPKF